MKRRSSKRSYDPLAAVMMFLAAISQQPVADAVILDVDKPEAEWSLKVVAYLFEYFIVAPAKDAEKRKSFDKKIAEANRKPIKPLTA